MESLLESSVLWIEEIGENLPNYTTATINYFLETIGITSEITSVVMKQNDGLFIELIDYLKNLNKNYVSFDNFQIQLLQIFILILVTIVMMIFGAWHFYGTRISERFLDPGKVIIII